MNNQEYYLEINNIAESIVDDAMEQKDNDRSEAEEFINDSLLHEVVDGHQWIIYYAYNLDVIGHSNNDEYMIDNFGGESLEASLKDGGLNGLHTAIAFWAMYADVQELIDTKIDEKLESLEEVA
tara:strand:- start:183 stop:554 length:372 start_codon:yes stop_codon:yes gene_type:complete